MCPATSTGLTIGIAGAGLLGRLAAWQLARAGHRVSVFDPAAGPLPAFDGQGPAGFTAAGMLSPLAERESAEPDVAARGWYSIARWGQICAQICLQAGAQANTPIDAPAQAPRGTPDRQGPAPLFACHGSLLVAHGPDRGAALRVLQRLGADAPAAANAGAAGHTGAGAPRPQALDADALQALEPTLHSAHGAMHAWLLPGEAHIDTVTTLQALHDAASGVQWHWGQCVTALGPGWLEVSDFGPMDASAAPAAPAQSRRSARRLGFDLVLDLRGTGARPDCAVRGVRGEVVWLHAPGVALQRPVRLLHPRHRVYIVPRPGGRVLVGASEIESEDRGPMTLRSAVELMAAAHSVLPGLDEARILRLDANLRPALPDNRPLLQVQPGLLRINGLYRHGWLLAPSLLDEALQRAGLATPLDASQDAPLNAPLNAPLDARASAPPVRAGMTAP